ncbi:glycosyltransferase [Methylobacterium oxalidis]|uniref:Glycosyl transferase family 28 C-terminal domain-containing protein n=1 Tax=Methylobacterium oxalidis TaxID=944322 RepID=A0A512J5W7_9HYPH|nr:glycosyltransferase [Methylobacterium oxalidis]GEP05249.1 hypothetical protein MOX02_32870 [Methylobacterium oxalidis]GJE29949.1 UDP-N-acetylglucosamine--N-acetylmuramyl-(pentapeptide) pyrophosphoryl-undecaprenol N-acetylglucosamine transferase [Methylobacterium oxalidis]GLS64707.1 hypothetical protein GCM10007888_30880 [Methylobacterium oxalidis]
MRVLIAVTHLLGAGHLTRAAALARGLACAGHAVVLVTGGRPAPMVSLEGVEVVELPPVRVEGTAFGTLLDADGGPAGEHHLARRRRLLLETFARCRPDAVVTELFPFGRRALADEFLALLEAARARIPRPVVLASIRDILVAPDRAAKVREAGERIAAWYDAVLVHGDPALAPLDASWPVDTELAARLRYTGYVDEGVPCPPAGERRGILVSAGSSAAGTGLLRAAAEAARGTPDLGWRILAGHGVPDAVLAEIGEGLPAGTIGRSRPDFRALLAGSALSVSACGYNTAVDLLATGTPALLVPFEAGRETEQRLRAERLAARGLAGVLPEAGLDGAILRAAVRRSLAAAPPPPHGIDLGGIDRSVAIIEALAGRTARPPVRGQSGLAGLRAALDAAADEGRRVAIWWRDDDAVAATPALDRLLALARAAACPLLVAAIPAAAEASLAAALSGADPTVSAAVHGLAHANHAPAGAKPAEFGADRPLGVRAREAASALSIARERLPADRLLPVFVPPWNRLAPDLAAALPGLGYTGLSSVPGPSVPGLIRADVDLDPIDWRGTRSLVDPEVLLDRLSRRVAEASGPIGILTHHRAHDAAIWAFLDRLLPLLARHPAVECLDPRHLFRVPAMDAPAPAWPCSASGLRARVS